MWLCSVVPVSCFFVSPPVFHSFSPASFSLARSLARSFSLCVCMRARHPCLYLQYVLRLASYTSGNHYPLVGGPLSPVACQLFLLHQEIWSDFTLRYLNVIVECTNVYGKSVKWRPFLWIIESFLFWFVCLLFHEMDDFSFVNNSTLINSFYAYIHIELYTCKHTRWQITRTHTQSIAVVVSCFSCHNLNLNLFILIILSVFYPPHFPLLLLHLSVPTSQFLLVPHFVADPKLRQKICIFFIRCCSKTVLFIALNIQQ